MKLRIDPVGVVMLIWFIWAGDQYIKQEIKEDGGQRNIQEIDRRDTQFKTG